MILERDLSHFQSMTGVVRQNYKTAKQLQNLEDIKKPDAIWFVGGNGYPDLPDIDNMETGDYAVELELTPKWGNEFDRLIQKTRNIIEEKICVGAIYIFRSRANLERYKKAMSTGADYKIWKKQPGKTGRWIEMGVRKMPQEIADRIYFYLLQGNSLVKP